MKRVENMENEFKVTKGKPTTRSEQETIITFDREADEWTIYTDVPTHARQWEEKVIASSVYPNKKMFHEETGQLIGIEGKINGSVSIRKVLSEKAKETNRISLQKAREQLNM